MAGCCMCKPKVGVSPTLSLGKGAPKVFVILLKKGDSTFSLAAAAAKPHGLSSLRSQANGAFALGDSILPSWTSSDEESLLSLELLPSSSSSSSSSLLSLPSELSLLLPASLLLLLLLLDTRDVPTFFGFVVPPRVDLTLTFREGLDLSPPPTRFSLLCSALNALNLKNFCFSLEILSFFSSSSLPWPASGVGGCGKGEEIKGG